MIKQKYEFTRHKCGRGFTYKYLSNKTLIDDKKKDWIKSLAIPPAWRDVEITTNKKSKIFAIGRDAKNRKQYIYNPKFREKKEKEKFSRMVHFASALPKMRMKTSSHLSDSKLSKNKVLACMVQLLDNAYFRAGSERYSKNNDTYGLTTLRSKHMTIKEDSIEFDYVGKSGKEQHKEVQNDVVVNILEELDEVRGYELFKYIDDEGEIVKIDRPLLNEYIKEVMGDKFTAKDFRTWAGTYLAAKILSELKISDCEKTNKTNILKAVDKVASILGNTPSVARSSYIDPQVINSYSNGVTIDQYLKELNKEIDQDDFTTIEEKAVMKLLENLDS